MRVLLLCLDASVLIAKFVYILRQARNEFRDLKDTSQANEPV